MKIEPNNIYLSSCLDMLPKMEDNTVDCVISSPPYNLGTTVRGNLYADYGDDLSQDEYYNFMDKVIGELIRVTKYYVFFNFMMVKNNKLAYLKLMDKYKYNIKDIIIWKKDVCQPAVQPTCLSSAFEFVVVFAKKELAKNRSFERAFFNNRVKGQFNKNIIEGPSASSFEFNTEKGTNKAIFPQYFVRWFLEKFTQEGDIVLDPFIGTGSTALVCKQMNRKYIGFDISKEYVDICLRRLSQQNLADFGDNNGKT